MGHIADDSVTESESDEEIAVAKAPPLTKLPVKPAVLPKVTARGATADEDSVTESESEDEAEVYVDSLGSNNC